jgi:hypothetical protein
MRLVPGFLTSLDIARLHRWLTTDPVFEPGDRGTGYDVARLPVGALRTLRRRSLQEMGLTGDEGHDCYVVRYVTGSSIPKHTDPPIGLKYYRMNAIIQAPEEGGVLHIGDEPIRLDRGDAYVFRPDVEAHGVTMVTAGTRLVWAVGARLT